MTVAYNLPDGPKTPVFLRLIKFILQPVKYLEDFAKIYGDSFTLRAESGNPLVYFSHPEALQRIFTADSSHLTAGSSGLEFLMGSNSLVTLGDGDRHLRQRQLLTPPFHGERMRVYGETIREIALQTFDANVSIGKPFKIRTVTQEITLRVILRLVFGVDEGELFDQLRLLLSSVMDFLNSPLMSVGLFFGFMQKDYGPWSPWGRMLRQLQEIDSLIYALIEERRAETNSLRQDILSLMLAARYEDGQPMSDQEIRDQLMTLLVAGHETTASALTWAFYWVDMLPSVREKLLQELDTLGDNPEANAISKLPYLTAVCQETLRIYPIVISAFPRIVRSPMTIMGYDLPPKAIVIPSIYLAHHRESVYPESKKFKPERFLSRSYSQYEYFPFGGGSRTCIGLAFAQYEMKIVLATLLSQYQISLRNKRPVTPVRRGLTLAAPAGLQAIAKPRTDKKSTTLIKVPVTS